MNFMFVDLDAAIEKAEEKSITEIFQTKKEIYFRAIEQRILMQWCEFDGAFVMATGGGTPCFFDNMRRMNNVGVSVFLDVPTRTIADRMLRSDLKQRPLLASSSADEVKDRMEFLRSQRLPFYKQADITLSPEEIDLDFVIQKIGSLKRGTRA